MYIVCLRKYNLLLIFFHPTPGTHQVFQFSFEINIICNDFAKSKLAWYSVGVQHLVCKESGSMCKSFNQFLKCCGFFPRGILGSVVVKCKKTLRFEVQTFFGLKLPNSLRKSIKKFLHFKFFTFQNAKFEISRYNNPTFHIVSGTM